MVPSNPSHCKPIAVRKVTSTMRSSATGTVRSIVYALLLIAACMPARAAESITFYLEDEPIYTSSDKDSPGFMMDIVMKMADIMHVKPKVRFLPWKRAQLMAMRTPNAMIFPLTRTDWRENHYRWVCKLFDVPVMFITKAGSPKIDTPQQAMKVRGIGVIIGTPQEAKLKTLGVTYVAMPGSQLYDALETNQVSAIYTAKPEALLGWREAGYKDKLQFGDTLQVLPLWIAANRDSNAVDVHAWQAALREIKQSGYFDAMVQKYFEH